MGDLRFRRPFERVRTAVDPSAAIRDLDDEQVIAALASASGAADPYLVNILATAAMNRARTLRNVVSHITEGILTTDLDQAITFANPAASAILGRPQEALVGMRLREAFDAAPADSLGAAFASCLQGLTTVDTFVRVTRRGAASPVEASVTPLVREGEPEGVLVVFRDVSERQEAARRIAMSEKRFRSLFENNLDLVVLFREDGRVRSFNPAAEAAFGVRSGEVEGHSFARFTGPEERAVIENALAAAARSEGARIEVETLGAKARPMWLEAVFAPVLVDGRSEGIFMLARDITHQRRAAREFRRRHQIVVGLARDEALRRGDFLAAIRGITKAASEGLHVARVGFWRFEADPGSVHLVQEHLAEGQRPGPTELMGADAPRYFAEVVSERLIDASDAFNDERTSELREGYLIPLGIRSMLDVPVRAAGALVGILCFEHVGPPREWSPEDKGFAAALGDLAAMAFLAGQRREDLHRLQHATNRLKLVLANAPVVVYALDRDGVFVMCEGNTVETLGAKPEDVVGINILDVEIPSIVEHARRALAGESFTSTEFVQGRTFEMIWRPTRDAEGSIQGVAGIATDVTETRARMDALQEREERFRALADASSEGIILHLDGTIVDLNKVAEELSGYSRAELIGESVSKLAPPDEETALVARIASGFEGAFVAKGQHKDGSINWFELTARSASYHGQEARVVTIRPLVGEWALGGRTEAENEIAASRRLNVGLARALEAAGEGVCVLDEEGRIRSINAVGAKMLGLTPVQGVGESFHALAHPEPEPSGECGLADAIARSGMALPCAETHLGSSDARVKVTYALARTPEPTPGLVVVFRKSPRQDAAAQSLGRLNRELRYRVQELADANRELEAFAYSASHDLRSPLRAIDVLAEALQEDYGERLDADGARLLVNLRGEAARLSRLVEDLLMLSRATRAEMEVVRVDLSEVARSVIEELRAAEPDRVVEFVVQDGLVANADARLARVLLMNLIGNAWKYSRDTPNARIRFDAIGEGRNRIFRVSDNGPGFKPSEAKRVFRAFERLSNAAGFPGTGVGLATVRRIVERHGGHVSAEGRLGEGATFSFTLPGPEDGPS